MTGAIAALMKTDSPGSLQVPRRANPASRHTQTGRPHSIATCIEQLIM